MPPKTRSLVSKWLAISSYSCLISQDHALINEQSACFSEIKLKIWWNVPQICGTLWVECTPIARLKHRKNCSVWNVTSKNFCLERHMIVSCNFLIDVSVDCVRLVYKRIIIDRLIYYLCLQCHDLEGHSTKLFFSKKLLIHLKMTLQVWITAKWCFLKIKILHKGVHFFQASWAVPPILASWEQKMKTFCEN